MGRDNPRLRCLRIRGVGRSLETIRLRFDHERKRRLVRVLVEVHTASETHVAGCCQFGAHSVDFNEAARVGLVEGIARLVGRKVEVVQGGVGASTCHRCSPTVQRHANVTTDVGLRVLDESVQRILER